jgi:hypothetical protein
MTAEVSVSQHMFHRARCTRITLAALLAAAIGIKFCGARQSAAFIPTRVYKTHSKGGHCSLARATPDRV